MSIDLKTIIINNNESLLAACGYLHNSLFDLSSLSYDKEHQTCSMTFEREFFEDPSLAQRQPKFLIFEKATYPLAESILTLNGVKSIEVSDKVRLDRYTFNECSIQDNNLTFLFSNHTLKYYEEVKIITTLNQHPNGSLVDQKLLDHSRCVYTLRFLRFFSFSKY